MSRHVVRAAVRRALALLVGCVLAVAWVGSARAMCAMTPGHATSAVTEHAAATGTAMAETAGASTHAMDAAMVGHPRAPHPGGDSHPGGNSPSDEGCPMHGRGGSPCTAPAESQTRHDGWRVQASVQASVHGAGDAPPSGSPSGGSHTGTMPSECAAAAHCAVLTVAALTPAESTDAATHRVARARANGPLLGASESAAEPTVPPPRSV